MNCSIPKCAAACLPEKPMCLTHFRSVPLLAQQEFYRAAANLKNVRKTSKAARAVRLYQEATAKIIKAVAV